MNQQLMQMLKQIMQQGGQQTQNMDGGKLMQLLQQGRQNDVNVSKRQNRGGNRPQRAQQSGGQMDKQKLMQLMKMLQQKKAQQG